ncbi:hypothetical protein AAG584_21085 [Vreelandella titanicae]|uniref:hypothetical protein n=1 Tax=Vreelandella titanicae TaxID=664683 RepID=UPI00038C9937|nr:hypothetical protein HALA3H3_260010 [Halomonas sp. A3H3]
MVKFINQVANRDDLVIQSKRPKSQFQSITEIMLGSPLAYIAIGVAKARYLLTSAYIVSFDRERMLYHYDLFILI